MPEISKTADQALTVLWEVAENGPVTPAAVARSLGMNRTVAHRLLATLHQRGFITRHEDGFVPGAVLVRLANRVQPELRARARPIMQRLCDLVDETVVLHAVEASDAVVVDQIVSRKHVVRVEHQIGSRHLLTKGASGRAILAFSSGSGAKRVIDRTDEPELLQEQLDEVRQIGYSLSHDELQNGIHGLAVPVMSEAGVAASLAILVPLTRAEALPSYIDELASAATELSTALTNS